MKYIKKFENINFEEEWDFEEEEYGDIDPKKMKIGDILYAKIKTYLISKDEKYEIINIKPLNVNINVIEIYDNIGELKMFSFDRINKYFYKK